MSHEMQQIPSQTNAAPETMAQPQSPRMPMPPLPANNSYAMVSPFIANPSDPHGDPTLPRPRPEETPDHATGIAGWLHRHRWFTKEPFTYTLYQFVRSTLASIPYGFGMAAGHHAFGFMSAKGQKMGLTEEGIKLFSKTPGPAGVAAVEAAAAKFEAGEIATAIFKEGRGAQFGRNMMRLGNSPLNAAVQIALGFTMFRFTGGLVKNLRDRVMNEKNTEEDTAYEVKRAGKTLWETAKINWPAESTGTPIAALVLGFISSAFTPSSWGTPKLAEGEKFIDGVKRVWSPKAKLLQNSAVWTVSYSLFFLAAESLFKDKQISRGLWKGHPNSLKNGPDDIVGGPGAVNFQTPENQAILYLPAEEGYKKQEKDDDRAKDSYQKLRYPFFTGEPSMGRFLIRRILPVAVGISAYAALKRVGQCSRSRSIRQISWIVSANTPNFICKTISARHWRPPCLAHYGRRPTRGDRSMIDSSTIYRMPKIKLN